MFETGEGDRLRRVLLVQADLIWFGSEHMPKLLESIRDKWGIDAAGVFLHASHTHGSPQTSALFSPKLGVMDSAYVEHLHETILSGIDTASRSMEAVTVERGSGECRIGIHRRVVENGVARMAPNPDGPYDPEVTVIRFKTERGQVKGIWFHYICHPTTSSDNAVSSEYPGVAMTRLERELGDEALASFLQGCCGDIRPALHRDGKFYSGSMSDVERMGNALAEQVLGVLARPMKQLAAGSLSAASDDVRLPYEQLPDRAQLEAAAATDGNLGDWARLLLSPQHDMSDSATLKLNAAEFAEGLTLLGMNAEIVSDYGRFVKAASSGDVLPIPYSNGMIGYVPTAQQLAEGGYESRDSGLYFGMPSPFRPEIEGLIQDRLAKLIDAVKRR